MTDGRRSRPHQSRKAVRQAAIWSVRLRKAHVTLAELRSFQEWRQQPENRAAFQMLLRSEGLR